MAIGTKVGQQKWTEKLDNVSTVDTTTRIIKFSKFSFYFAACPKEGTNFLTKWGLWMPC